MKKQKELGHYTRNEIFEIPNILCNLTRKFSEIEKVAKKLISNNINRIYLIGAGSSYHAGFAISYMFNRLSKIPCYTQYSMEFQYLTAPILKQNDLVIAISQSGETQDTVEATKIANEIGCITIGLSNNLSSSLISQCDYKLLLDCGEEKSVLATKTYLAELTILATLALYLAKCNEQISNEEFNKIWDELNSIPAKVKEIIPILHQKIKDISLYFKFAKFCFILGSGADYATAMEASLKLKEGARIFGQAYSTAEFPHGPITLADSDAFIIAIIPHENDKRKEKLLNLLNRIKERNAMIFGVYESDEFGLKNPKFMDIGLRVPNTIPDLQPLVVILPIQLLTLEIARIKGIDCDTPKFLTKVSEL